MANLYWVGGTNTWDTTAGTKWATSSGGTGGHAVPTTSDNVFFDSYSNSNTITVTSAASAASVDFYTGSFTGTFTLGGNFLFIVSVLKLSSGMTWVVNSGGMVQTSSTGTLQITCNGNTIGSSLQAYGIGRVIKFMDTFACGGSLIIQGGTINTNGQTVTCGNVITTGNGGTLNLTSSTININGSTSSAWSASTFDTISSTGCTIKLLTTSTTNYTFAGAGYTYNNFYIGGNGTGNITISGSNTFNILGAITSPHTVIFTAGTTQTIQQLAMSGTSGNLNTLKSSSNGSTWTLSDSTGSNFVDYVSLRDSTVTGGASFTAGSNSIDVSNNHGWTFNPDILLSSTVINSDYKWLTSTLKTAQLGPAYTPYFKVNIVDDTINPSNILTNPNVPVLGDATMSPDGYVLMAGGDGSGNLKFWKLADASATIPSGTTLVASGVNYTSTLNTSIACSDWIEGSYVIDVYYWGHPGGGGNTPQMARSSDGGNTWVINPFSYSIPPFMVGQNFYIAAGQPVYLPTLNIVTSTAFYIRGGVGVSSAFYKICYLHYSGQGLNYDGETTWSRSVDSQDWTLHSLDVQYLNGSYYIVFSGFHNWFDISSGNSNYNLYITRLDSITSNTSTDVWQLVRNVFISNSPQATNYNSFTYPKISNDSTSYYLVCKAYVGEGLQNAGTGSNQVGTVSNNYYYMMKSIDLVNFSYPQPIYFTDGTIYSDTSAVTFVNQNSNYYLIGNGQNWKFTKNNVVADISNWVINYQIQEISGSSFQLTLTLANANNYWIGSSPVGTGASAIAINKKVILEQGYITSAGKEVAPRNVFYIDTIQLNSTASDNTANITCRDINRNLQKTSTKFSFTNDGPSYYNDLFDGTTLQNWNQISGTWSESAGFLNTTSSGIVTQGQLINNQESCFIFTMCTMPQVGGNTVSVYPLYQDSSNYFEVQLGVSGSNNIITTNLVIGGSNVLNTSYILYPITDGRVPILIHKYNYHTYDILIGTPNNSGVEYTADVLNNVIGSTYYPFKFLTGVKLDSYFASSTSFLVQASVGLGAYNQYPYFQPFKYIQLSHSLSLQEAMEYIGGISGITNYARKTTFVDNQYPIVNYNGSYVVKNGFMVIQPTNFVINLNDPISNGQIDFIAKVAYQNNNQNYGFAFVVRLSATTGSPTGYFFQITQLTSGIVTANLNIGIGATTYQILNTNYGGTNSISIDITQWHRYRVTMIDQVLYLFIDDRCYLMWQDTNFTTNSIQFSNGYWGIVSATNSVTTIGNFKSYALYNQITNVSISPGDDMTGTLQNLLETSYAFSYTDQFGRYVGTVLNQTDTPTYTYQNALYQITSQTATNNLINEVIVTGNGVIATYKDPVLVALIGQIQSINITDYTIVTYQDALYRAQQELLNANRLNSENNPTQPMNVGAEVFDVVTLINTGNNSTSISGNFRVYNQTISNDGAKGQYSIQIETGSL